VQCVQSPLDHARRQGDVGLVRLLLEQGVSLFARTHLPALSPAAHGNDPEMARLVLPLVAQRMRQTVAESYPARAEAARLAVTVCMGFGAACQEGRADVVAAYLDAGLAPDPIHAEAFHHGFGLAQLHGHCSVQQQLRASRCFDAAYSHQFVLRAVARRDRALLRLLRAADTQTGAEAGPAAGPAGVVDVEQRPAAASDEDAMFACLVEEGVDVSARDRRGDTLLHALQDRIVPVDNEGGGLVDLAAALLRAGADCDARNRKGETPLMVALMRRLEPLVTLLLARGADVEARALDGSSALLVAAHSLQVEPMVRLLQRGARLDARNNRGQTALDVLPPDRQRDLHVQLMRLAPPEVNDAVIEEALSGSNHWYAAAA
jgi:hypothetical protein